MKFECDSITQNIAEANAEIEDIKNRLATKKSGLIDITTKNKDKDTLKELAQIVIDIKHRRQFAETPLEIITNLENQLGISLMNEIEKNVIDSNSSIVAKDYDEYTNFEPAMPVEVKVVTDINDTEPTPKRGIKVINEATISTNLEGLGITKVEDELTENEAIKDESEEIETEAPVIETEPAIEEPKEEIESEPITEPTTETDTEPVTEAETEPVIEEPKELSEEEKIENEIDSILNTVNEESEEQEETTEDDDDTPLDIGAIINSTEENKITDIPNVNELSINTMFSNTNNENNDNMVSSEDLTIELDKYINNFRQDNE